MAEPSHKKSQPTWLVACAVGLLVALVAGLFAAAFAWPFSASDPKDIKFGVAGPVEQVELIETQLGAQQEGLFDFIAFDGRDAVVAAIESRDIVGGLVMGEGGTEMLTASAGNAQIAQMLTQMADAMKEQQAAAMQQMIAETVAQAKEQGAPAEQILALQQAAQERAAATTVTVTDVVPGGANAMGENLAMMPALIGGMATAALSFFLVKRPWYRILAVVSGVLFAGLTSALVFGPWMNLIDVSFGMLWLAFSCAIGAVAATAMGLGTLFGVGGLAVGAMLMMLVGNPWGGLFVPTEFLGGFMGWLGSHMPTGSLIQLIRDLSFFPEASQSMYWWVFAIWAAIGVVAWASGSMIQSARAKRQLAVTAA